MRDSAKRLRRIPASAWAGAVEETIATGPNPAVVAGAAGDVWLSIHEGGEVWRIRPS